jgi:hypothetical protein
LAMNIAPAASSAHRSWHQDETNAGPAAWMIGRPF